MPSCLLEGAIVKASTHIYLPSAHSVPKCTSGAGANDDELKDFLIGSPKNTNFASEKSDLVYLRTAQRCGNFASNSVGLGLNIGLTQL